MGRDRWSSRPIFIIAAIGSAVGLGNIWRFPYVCYENGGGAFLIPYFVALFTAGIPLMILEYGLGQRMQAGAPLAFWKIRKGWEWLGWWAILTGFGIVIYYAVIMAWCFCYLAYSLKLSWQPDTASFFFQRFLQSGEGPGQLGGLRWPILVGLALTWISIYFAIFKGVKSVGKVVMVTVPLPVILIGVFVVRGLTLPGAIEGLRFYLTPDFGQLLNPRVWLAAYGQVFFTLSLGFGVLIAYSSYLPKTSDVNNNAFITSLADAGISFFAGFAVFSTIGYLAFQNSQPVSEVITQGIGLAFIAYPTAISLLPLAPVFGILFFILLLTLGIDSAFSLVEAGVAGIEDEWHIPRRYIVIGICLLAFIGGIVFTTRAGLYWLDIADHFLTNFGLATVGLLECIVVGYLYGTRRFRSLVNPHSDFRVGIWWDVCILVITPLILVISLGRIAWERFRVPYEGYPQWALALGGWGLVLACVILAIILMVGSRRSPGDLEAAARTGSQSESD